MWIFRFPAAFLVALAAAFLFGLVGSRPAGACGSIHGWIAKYSNPGASDMQRESALGSASSFSKNR